MNDEFIFDAAETEPVAAETNPPPPDEVVASKPDIIVEPDTEFVISDTSADVIIVPETEFQVNPDTELLTSDTSADVIVIPETEFSDLSELIPSDVSENDAVLLRLDLIYSLLESRLPDQEAETETEDLSESVSEEESESETELFSFGQSEYDQIVDLLESINENEVVYMIQQKTAHKNSMNLGYIVSGGVAMCFAALCVVILAQYIHPRS